MAFPSGDILRCDPFDRISSTSNFIEGSCDGVRVVAFDCRNGRGKGSWSTTVIAAEKSGDVIGGLVYDSDRTLDQAGNWLVVHQPKFPSLVPKRIPVRELEARITSIRRPS